MLQFVPSKAIASILSEHGGSLAPYLSTVSFDENVGSALSKMSVESALSPLVIDQGTASSTIDKQVIDTYIRSTGTLLYSLL